MALKKLRMICAGGDKTLAEWDTDTVTSQRLAEIEREFKEKVAQGWFAADISEKRDVLIREFDPNAEILRIPRRRFATLPPAVVLHTRVCNCPFPPQHTTAWWRSIF